MLFSSLCESYFTYFNDETQDKTSTQHKVINRKFDYNGSINEHFTGVYTASKVLYTFPSASNKMCFLEKHFHDISICKMLILLALTLQMLILGKF